MSVTREKARECIRLPIFGPGTEREGGVEAAQEKGPTGLTGI